MFLRAEDSAAKPRKIFPLGVAEPGGQVRCAATGGISRSAVRSCENARRYWVLGRIPERLDRRNRVCVTVERSLPMMGPSALTRLGGENLIRGLIGSGTLVQGLRDELDSSAVRSREIAHRVANASNQATASFDTALDAALSGEAVDLEREMVSLADEQIRYEAVTEILTNLYSQIRSSIRRG